MNVYEKLKNKYMRNYSEEQADEWVEARKKKDALRKENAQKFYDNQTTFDMTTNYTVGDDGRYHYVYVIEDTNPSSKSRFYIGSRSSSELPVDDRYMGSSKILNKEIKKRPRDFHKKIIRCYSAVRESRSAESKIIHEKKAHDYDIFYNGLHHRAINNRLDKGRLLSKEEIKTYKDDL